jgi:hypothetical protein
MWILRVGLFFALVSRCLALEVEADFQGASVRLIEKDDATQTIRFMPGGDPKRGWACWWYFRVTGLEIGKALTLEVKASDLPMPQANGVPSNKPLGGEWAMPERAFHSVDGETWQQTAPGRKQGGRIVYTIEAKSPAMFVAWGPPYTPSRAVAFVRDMAARSSSADAVELAKSREGRSVPMLQIQEGDRPKAKRPGVWIQARQHAWESGSSWVCEGAAEWMLGDHSEAAWLRQNAEVYLVPIMDVDNTATGNGGKEALPHDYNRDWMEKPNWNEVAAAQSYVREFVKENRMDVFVDLHNPAPNDKKTFFYTFPPELVKEPMLTRRSQFIAIATATIGEVFPMLDTPKLTGASYHPLWKQISHSWVTANGNPHTVAACLETSWNTEFSTVEGYKAVGAALAKSVQQYLSRQPARQ